MKSLFTTKCHPISGKISILSLLFIILLSGCSSKPYAIIDGSRSKVTDQYNYDVIISGIDGRLYFDDLTVRNVEPGPHLVQLTSTKKGRKGYVSYQSWNFNAEPCKRYIIAAKHAKGNKFSNRHWEVEVLKVEPILSCKLEKENVEVTAK